VNCAGDRVFAGSGCSVVTFVLNPSTGQLVWHLRFDLPSRVLALFPCDSACYALTESRDLFLLSPASPPEDFARFPDRVLRADCVRGCIALLTKNYELFVIAAPPQFWAPEKRSVPDAVRNGHVPAGIHRVAAKSVLWEMHPGVLWLDDRAKSTVEIGGCCNRGGMKLLSPDRRAILTKKSRGEPAAPFFRSPHQIVAFDELVDAQGVVAVERRAAGLRARLFDASAPDVCRALLGTLDLATGEFPFALAHPMDCRMLFAGIRAIFRELAQEPLKERIVIAVAKVGPLVDALEYAALVDIAFVYWALSADLDVPHTLSALIAAVFCATRACANLAHPANMFDFGDALLDLAVAAVDHCALVPLEQIERLMELPLLCSPYLDDAQLRVLARMTLYVYKLDGIEASLQNQIVNFWSNQRTEILRPALNEFFRDYLRPRFFDFLGELALFPQSEIRERIWRFIEKYIPLSQRALHGMKDDTLKKLAPAINKLVTHGARLVTLRQQIVAYQEVDDRVTLNTINALTGSDIDADE
jgi:hypothetical protein